MTDDVVEDVWFETREECQVGVDYSWADCMCCNGCVAQEAVSLLLDAACVAQVRAKSCCVDPACSHDVVRA